MTNSIGAACAFSVLWLSWYRETKGIPDILKTFSDAHQAGLKAFTETITASQKSFDIRAEKTLDTFSALVREERSIYQAWHEQNLSRLDKIADEQREGRHYLRDLAHQLGLRAAVETERAKHDSDK